MSKPENVIEKARPNAEALQWDYFLPPHGVRYSMNLAGLAEDYKRYVEMTDKEFEANLEAAAHFAVFVSFYKNLKPIDCISDIGIIHQLIHLIQFRSNSSFCMEYLYKEIFPQARKNFKRLLKIELTS